MKPSVEKEQEQSTASNLYSHQEFNQGFNFEQWARQVRPQLIASLQKRGGR